jgi:uncharacterized membrane protein YecN with MAPEG domain
LGLLLFGLGACVTMERRRTQTYHAYQIDPANRLYRLVRAHGNTAEYAPMLSVLMLTAAQRDPSSWVLLVISLVTLSRYLHVIGMLVGPTLDARPNVFRLIGAPGTYLGGLLLCLAILAKL